MTTTAQEFETTAKHGAPPQGNPNNKMRKPQKPTVPVPTRAPKVCTVRGREESVGMYMYVLETRPHARTAAAVAVETSHRSICPVCPCMRELNLLRRSIDPQVHKSRTKPPSVSKTDRIGSN